MIRTTRSRLEIRQEPDGPAALAGPLFSALGASMALLALAAFVAHRAAPAALGREVVFLLLGIAAGCAAAGRLLLRRRGRVVVDLDHRMVARYSGSGASPLFGNQSWDLEEFSAVVLVRRERRRLLSGKSSARAEIVCLRRPDGLDLELYRTRDAGDGAETAERVARFSGLPYLGRRAS